MIKKCIVCGREFETYDKKRRGRRSTTIKRPINAVTCSKECSRNNCNNGNRANKYNKKRSYVLKTEEGKIIEYFRLKQTAIEKKKKLETLLKIKLYIFKNG